MVHVFGTAKLVEHSAELAEAPADTVPTGIYQAMAHTYTEGENEDISGTLYEDVRVLGGTPVVEFFMG